MDKHPSMNVGHKASYYKLSSKVQNVQVPILHKPSRFVPTSFIREQGSAVVSLLLLSLGKGIGDPQKLSLTIAIKRIDFYNLCS